MGGQEITGGKQEIRRPKVSYFKKVLLISFSPVSLLPSS
jgi:hypothetical protein